ncbi:MAG: HXXEE domain-containing protein [Bacteroidota bacterium]
MKHKQTLFASIILLFAMLWLPFGQYEFLLDNWVKIGTYAIPFLLIGAFSLNSNEQNIFKGFRFVSLLMLIAYIIHQYEEHWIDFFGNYYAFYTFNNQFILGALGESDSTNWPLTKESIFVINTTLVWLVASISILRSPEHVFPYFCMAAIIVVNGVVHILAGVANFQYNPGLLTSILVFLPLYVWIVRKNDPAVSNKRLFIIAGLIWAFLAHVIMVGGLLAANWFHLIPEHMYFIMLVAWSVLPAFLFRNR